MKSREYLDGFNAATILCAEFLEGMADSIWEGPEDIRMTKAELVVNYRRDAQSFRLNVQKTPGTPGEPLGSPPHQGAGAIPPRGR